MVKKDKFVIHISDEIERETDERETNQRLLQQYKGNGLNYHAVTEKNETINVSEKAIQERKTIHT